MNQLRFNIYPSLLDRFQDYLNSSEIYQEYWGFSEDAPFTEEEFEQNQLTELMNSINRVPYESQAADQGTAFNEVIDCILQKRKSEKMEITRLDGMVNVKFKLWNFNFPLNLCLEFSDYFKGSVQQVYTEGILNTKYGKVRIYGIIDQLLPLSIHDIKTSSRYKAGKYIKHWQHIVYPFCLNEQGNKVNDFEYNVAVINPTKTGVNYATHTEHYAFSRERDTERLKEHAEHFIEFLEAHKAEITDKKIFNHVQS